jgi:parallel beta-helix repeat protein
MFSRNLGRAFFRSAQPSAHRRRRLTRVGPCAADVLESRVLLSATLTASPAATPAIDPPVTLFVDPASSNPTVFHTIQSAVNAASAGDTIKVAPGTYNEDVTVGKSLTILGGQVLAPGESGPSTVEYEATGFTVSSANNVTINGFNIGGPSVAILATNTAHSTFDNNDVGFGQISLDGGVTHTEVANNSANFIKVTGNPSSNANDTFEHNTISPGDISLDASATGAVVSDNTVTTQSIAFSNEANNVTFSDNTAIGIFVPNIPHIGFSDHGNNSTYLDNTVEAKIPGLFGFEIEGGGTATLVGNTANGVVYGLLMSGPASATIEHNTFNNDDFGGIFIGSVGSATVTGNVANNSEGDGIAIQANSATISNNTANSNFEGFVISINGGVVSGNTALNNSGDGFTLNGVTQSTVTANTASGNGGDGIHLVGATNNTLFFNTADNNANDGFDVDVNSTDNVFIANTATGNNTSLGTGVDLFDASTGTGTAGTANTWFDNTAHTANLAGLL